MEDIALLECKISKEFLFAANLAMSQLSISVLHCVSTERKNSHRSRSFDMWLRNLGISYKADAFEAVNNGLQ